MARNAAIALVTASAVALWALLSGVDQSDQSEGPPVDQHAVNNTEQTHDERPETLRDQAIVTLGFNPPEPVEDLGSTPTTLVGDLVTLDGAPFEFMSKVTVRRIDVDRAASVQIAERHCERGFQIDVPYGVYSVEAICVIDEKTIRGTKVFPVPHGERTKVDITMGGRSVVHGSITRSDGAPASSVMLIASPRQGFQQSCVTTTGDNGRFEISGLVNDVTDTHEVLVIPFLGAGWRSEPRGLQQAWHKKFEFVISKIPGQQRLPIHVRYTGLIPRGSVNWKILDGRKQLGTVRKEVSLVPGINLFPGQLPVGGDYTLELASNLGSCSLPLQQQPDAYYGEFADWAQLQHVAGTIEGPRDGDLVFVQTTCHESIPGMPASQMYREVPVSDGRFSVDLPPGDYWIGCRRGNTFFFMEEEKYVIPLKVTNEMPPLAYLTNGTSK